MGDLTIAINSEGGDHCNSFQRKLTYQQLVFYYNLTKDILIDKYRHLYLWLHLYQLVDAVVATDSYFRKHSTSESIQK